MWAAGRALGGRVRPPGRERAALQARRLSLAASAAPGKLRVVGVPIGSATDMAPRAAMALAEADLVIAESEAGARAALAVAGRLVAALGGKPRRLGHEPSITVCGEAEAASAAPRLAAAIAAGRTGKAVLISDAGTPAVSDPGCHVVRECLDAGVVVSPVPGPSAVVAALSASGEGSFEGFAFWGWVPQRRARKLGWFQQLRGEHRPVVVLDSPRRVAESLVAAAEALSPPGAERRVVVCRELTKRHEQVLPFPSVAAAAQWAAQAPVKGEVTLVFGALPRAAEASEAPASSERERCEALTLEDWQEAAAVLRSKGVDPAEAMAALPTPLRPAGMSRGELLAAMAEHATR